VGGGGGLKLCVKKDYDLYRPLTPENTSMTIQGEDGPEMVHRRFARFSKKKKFVF